MASQINNGGKGLPPSISLRCVKWTTNAVLLLAALAYSAGTAMAEDDYAWQKNSAGFQPKKVSQQLAAYSELGGIGGLGGLALILRCGEKGWPDFPLDVELGGYYRLPRPYLGAIDLPGRGEYEGLDIEGDWSTLRLEWSFEKCRMTLWLSRLTPGILIETDNPQLELFKNNTFREFHFAHPDPSGGGVSAGTLSGMPSSVPGTATQLEFPPDVAWMLVWLGDSNGTEFNPLPATSTRPAPSAPGHSHSLAKYMRKADHPFLLVFGKPPMAATVGKGGGIVLFADDMMPSSDNFEGMGRLVAFPIGSGASPYVTETEAWRREFPADLFKRCEWLASVQQRFPVSVRESYELAPDKTSVTIHERFSYESISKDDGSDGRLAPIPPLLALAARQGVPVAFSEQTADSGVKLALGPFMGIENVDEYSMSLPCPTTPAKVTRAKNDELRQELAARLEKEVKAILDAGHLAPFYMPAAIKHAIFLRTPMWSGPGDPLYFMTRLMPFLDGGTKAGVANYLKGERTEYPPELGEILPYHEGARRERWTIDEFFLEPDTMPVFKGQKGFYAFNKTLPVEGLYALAEYYRLAAPDEQCDLTPCRELLFRHLEHHDWGTCCLFARWFGQGWEGVHQDNVYGIGGVMDMNRLFAGALGFARLAEKAGDNDGEALGMGLAAKFAAARVGMEHLAAFSHETGFSLLPDDLGPDWMNMLCFGGGDGGALSYYSARFDSPQKDVRRPYITDEFGVWLHENHPPLRWGPYTQAPFDAMTPELAEWLRLYAMDCVEGFCARVEEHAPEWHMAYMRHKLGVECFFAAPIDAYSVFLARAWILQDPPAKLAACLDVPWTGFGDFFFLHKLALALEGLSD